MKNKEFTNGYAMLLTVIVLGAVGLVVVSSLALSNNLSISASLDLTDSNQAKALANTCAETALQEIRDTTTFSGTGNLSLTEGTCTYTVVNTGGTNRDITSSGSVGNTIRKIKISIDAINPQINITLWEEVADF